MSRGKGGKPAQYLTPLYYAESAKFYWCHCWYCGKELVRDKLAKKLKADAFTRDHLHPRSEGGKMVVPACNSCNKRKHAYTLEQFRKKDGKTLFYAEEREAELKIKVIQKKFRPTLKQQLAAFIPPPVYEFKPRSPKCLVRRELILHTPFSRLLRRLFIINN